MDEPKPKKSVYEEIEELYGDQGEAKAEPEPEAAKPSAPTKSVAPVTKTVRRKSGPTPITVAIAVVVSLGIGAFAGYRFEKGHIKDHETMVVVNNTPITYEDFQHRLDVASGNTIIHQMVVETLQEQFFKQKNSMPSEGDVDTAYANVLKNKQNAASIAASRQTPDDVKKAIRLQLAQNNLLKSGVAITDAEVKVFYDQNVDHRNPKALYYQPDMALVDVIITKSEAQIEKAKDALLGGQTFGDVAKQYSVDEASAANGGRLDIIRKGQSGLLTKFPEVGDAIFSMVKGNSKGPIRSAEGTFWLIRCEGTRPEETLPFSKVQDDARTRALLAKGVQVNGKQVASDFADFQTNSKIEIRWPQYTDAVQPKKAQQ